MKILAIEHERPGATAGQFQAHLREEAVVVWQLYQSDTIREIYFRADRHTAVLVLECENVAEAGAILAALPLVKAGLIEFDVIPLMPYPGFSRLFSV